VPLSFIFRWLWHFGREGDCFIMENFVDKVVRHESLFCDNNVLQIEPLGGGFVNRAYKITTDHKTYFLRINSAQYQHLNLNLSQEFQALSLANTRQIVPKPLVYNEDMGYLLLEYLPSKKVEIQEFRDVDNLTKLFEKLRQIHQMQTVDRRCNAYHLIENYIIGARQAGVSIPVGFDGLLSRMREIEQNKAGEANRFCHNDFYPLNILKSGQDYYIIDWELCGVGDIYFDLAIFPSIYRYTIEQEMQLLETYFGESKVGEEHLGILQDMKYVNVLREAAWAYYHSGLNIQFETHAFDYAGHAARTVDKLMTGENSLGI
jgi:thiamine kinase-like enzyme